MISQEIIFEILIKGLWAGIAAIGFAVLFNVPKTALIGIFTLGLLGSIIKFYCLNINISYLFASFIGASFIGVLSVPTAYKFKHTPVIFALPGIIPMVPGALAYKMMLGLIDLATIKLSVNDPSTSTLYLQKLTECVSNATQTIFVLIAISTGIAVPMLVARRASIKKHFRKLNLTYYKK